jgi:hypothetical protein
MNPYVHYSWSKILAHGVRYKSYKIDSLYLK